MWTCMYVHFVWFYCMWDIDVFSYSHVHVYLDVNMYLKLPE